MKQKAVIVGCFHQCPKFDGNKPHVGGNTENGAEKVFIEGESACRVGDELSCQSPEKDKIKTGSKNKVYIEKKLAAIQFGQTEHGGIILKGAKKVYIG